MKLLNYFFIISLVVVADLHSMDLVHSWYSYYIKGEKTSVAKLPELSKDNLKQIFEQLVNRRDFENEDDVINTLNSFNAASKNANLAVKEFLNEKAQKDPKYRSLFIPGDPTKTISKQFTKLKSDVIERNFIENINKFSGKFPLDVAISLATIQFRNLETRDLHGQGSAVSKAFKDVYNNPDIESSIVLEMLERLLKAKSIAVFQEILPLSYILYFVDIEVRIKYAKIQELTDLNEKLSNLNKYEPRLKLILDTLNLFTKYKIEKSLKTSEYTDLDSKIESIKRNLLYIDPTTSPTSNLFFGKKPFYPNYILSVHGLPKTIIILRQILELLEKIKMHGVKKI